MSAGVCGGLTTFYIEFFFIKSFTDLCKGLQIYSGFIISICTCLRMSEEFFSPRPVTHRSTNPYKPLKTSTNGSTKLFVVACTGLSFIKSGEV